jgi:D-alanyl-D-alanine carboxypeptidase/D-alanyl-D-alanine-endopeptidase (penicillin-binding protein 4)
LNFGARVVSRERRHSRCNDGRAPRAAYTRAAPAILALAVGLAACSPAPRFGLTPVGPVSSAVLHLQRDIDGLIAAPALDHSSWGVFVRSLKNNTTLYALNARKLLVPASTMKIVTLAAAAERLSWDFSYETRVAGVGTLGSGVLDGDLVVVGTGDPSIDDWDGAASRLFQSWGEQLKAAGVRTVTGRVIGDDNAFDDERFGAGWARDDLISVTAGSTVADPPSVTIAPARTPLVVRNLLKTSPPDVLPSIAVRRLPGSTTLEVRGSVPAGSARTVRNVSVDNPTLYFVAALRDALIADGIDIRGPAVDIDEIADPPSRERGTVLLTHRSPPLSMLAETMVKLSQNLYAETLLKSLGASAGAGTADAGRSAAVSVVREWGVTPADLVMADGSGLSRYNLATPEAIVTILTHIDRDDRLRAPFEAALPVAGRDGTLAQRMRGTAAEGNARAKTGSFSNARGLAGYVRTADDEPLVFSIIVNNFGTSAEVVEQTMDSIVVRLASFRR